MHDIDRTLTEFEEEGDITGLEEFELEFEGESDIYEEGEMESPFDEEEEMELADALLNVSSEAELDQFLGSFFKKVGRKVGRFFRSGVGRKIGRFFKGVARRVIPMAGGALGGMFGGPAGAMLGRGLASRAGRMFGLELEGLSPEDQEYEVARQFVRFAGTAAKRAMLAPSGKNPDAAAKAAIVGAASRYAPGLLSGARTAIPSGKGRSGRWIRRGRRIIVMGV